VKKFLLILAIAVAVAALFFVVFRYASFGKITSGEFEISTIEIGSVVSTVPAEGTVEPESEVLILSPASSIIHRIVKGVGSKVELGEAIIILDPDPAQAEIERIEDQLEVKRNSLRKNELNARMLRSGN